MINSPLLTGKDRAPNRVGHWRSKGGGCKVGHETESGELLVPNMLKHTQEGTPETRHVKHGVRKVLHVDDLPRSEVRKGEEEGQQKSC